jgi:hypothetical protein
LFFTTTTEYAAAATPEIGPSRGQREWKKKKKKIPFRFFYFPLACLFFFFASRKGNTTPTRLTGKQRWARAPITGKEPSPSEWKERRPAENI